MEFDPLKDDWQRFGLRDLRWAIATAPATKGSRRDVERFPMIIRSAAKATFGIVLVSRSDFDGAWGLEFGCGAGWLTRRREAFSNVAARVDAAISRIEIAHEIRKIVMGVVSRVVCAFGHRCAGPDVRRFNDLIGKV